MLISKCQKQLLEKFSKSEKRKIRRTLFLSRVILKMGEKFLKKIIFLSVSNTKIIDLETKQHEKLFEDRFDLHSTETSACN